ncbi:hypothetical protein FHS10_005503 [Mucilaginibacter dorajii]|nr:hypothetical protein [Mucilaginibacter dorajii]
MSLRGTKQSHALQGESAQFAIASYLPMTSIKRSVILNAVKDLFYAIPIRPVKFANRCFVPQHDRVERIVVTSFPPSDSSGFLNSQ